MLALLSLLGVAMAASAFVDVAGSDDTEAGDVSGDAGGGSSLAEGSDTMSFDVLLDAGEPVEADDPQPAAEPQIATPDTAEPEPFVDEAPEGMILTGTDADDIMQGGQGADQITGDGGDDALWGDLGDDTIDGGTGADLLNGGTGDDTINGGEGADTLEGSWGHDTLVGGEGVDTLNGGDGNDVLDGRDGELDFLNGSSGDDILISGGGDNMNGGDGADTFRLTDTFGANIDDYNPEEDRLEVEYTDTPPVLSTETSDFGLTLYADGEAVATLPGVTELDVNKIALIAV